MITMTQLQTLTKEYVKKLQNKLAFIKGFPGEIEQDEIDDLVQALDAVGGETVCSYLVKD